MGDIILPDGSILTNYPDNPTEAEKKKLQQLKLQMQQLAQSKRQQTTTLPAPATAPPTGEFQPTPLPITLPTTPAGEFQPTPPPDRLFPPDEANIPISLDQLSQQTGIPFMGGGRLPSQTPTGKFLKETGKKSALPMIGGGAGLLIGGWLGFPLVGEAIGSSLGEGLNQLIGITPESKVGIATSFMLPSVTRGVASGIGTMGKAVGRRVFSPALQEFAIENIERLPSVLRPSKPLARYFGMVERFEVKTSLSNTVREVNRLLAKEKGLSTGTRNRKVISVLNGLKKKLTEKEKENLVEISFTDIYRELRRIGQRIGNTTGEEQGVYKKLFKTIWEDIEQAVNSRDLPPGAKIALKTATRASRRNFIADDLENAIKVSIKDAKMGEDFRGIDITSILTKIRRGKQFENFRKAVEVGAITKGEVRQIVGTLEQLRRKIPKIPSSREGGLTSGMFWKRAAIISAFIQLFGADNSANAWLTGIISSAGIDGAEKLLMSKGVTNMLLSDRGRKVLEGLLNNSRMIDQTKAVVIMQFLKGMFTEEGIDPSELSQTLPQIPQRLRKQLPFTGRINQ